MAPRGSNPERVLERLSRLVRDVHAADLTVRLHAGGDVHAIAPDIVSETALPDHPGDDGSRMNPDPNHEVDTQTPPKLFNIGDHIQSEMGDTYGVIQLRFRNPRSGHIRVTDRLDLLDSPSRRGSIERGEQPAEKVDGRTRRESRRQGCESDEITEQDCDFLKSIRYRLFSIAQSRNDRSRKDAQEQFLFSVPQNFLLERGGNTRPQKRRIESFWQVVFSAGLNASYGTVDVVKSRDYDDWYVACALLRFQPAKDVESRQARHNNIQENEIELFRLGFRQRDLSILGQGYRMSLSDKAAMEKVAVGRLIINDEDPADRRLASGWLNQRDALQKLSDRHRRHDDRVGIVPWPGLIQISNLLDPRQHLIGALTNMTEIDHKRLPRKLGHILDPHLAVAFYGVQRVSEDRV